MNPFTRSIPLAVTTIIVWSSAIGAQSVSPDPGKTTGATPTSGAATGSVPAADPGGSRVGVVIPPNYVIGPDDVLSVFFWKDQDMSREVVVRPDGKISLPVVNDLQASGLTPDQLRATITKAASRLYTDEPTVSIVVKQINSRKVYIMGSVTKPGTYPLMGPMTVVQLIAIAGGLTDYADKKKISIVSLEKGPNGVPWRYTFNYAEFLKGVNLKQNIELKPGDTVIVP